MSSNLALVGAEGRKKDAITVVVRGDKNTSNIGSFCLLLPKLPGTFALVLLACACDHTEVFMSVY